MTRILLSKGVTPYPARKSVEYQGLTLRRHPRGPELAIDLKAVARAQIDGKEALRGILDRLRADLIREAGTGLAELEPEDFHKLTLDIPQEAKDEILAILERNYRTGRTLVARELGAQNPTSKEINEAIEKLAQNTLSRLTSDVRYRASQAASKFAENGLEGTELVRTAQQELRDGSDKYVEDAASMASNRSTAIGRDDEASARSDQWSEVYYSSVLDANTCDACSEADGETGTSTEQITAAPNPDCAGWDRCRCIHIYTSVEEGTTVD